MTNPTDNGLERGTVAEVAFWGITTEAGPPFAMHEDPPPAIYDLEERTLRFGEQIILFAKKIPWNPVNNRLVDQLVGASTSIGANYCEADDGISRADFKHRISICREGIPGNQVLSPHGFNRRTHPQTRRARTLERSSCPSSDFQQNLAQHQNITRGTKFVIRHSHYEPSN